MVLKNVFAICFGCTKTLIKKPILSLHILHASPPSSIARINYPLPVKVCKVTMEPPYGLEPDDALALGVDPDTRLTAEIHLVSWSSNSPARASATAMVAAAHRRRQRGVALFQNSMGDTVGLQRAIHCFTGAMACISITSDLFDEMSEV